MCLLGSEESKQQIGSEVPENIKKVFKEFKDAKVDVFTMIIALARFMVGDEYEAYQWIKENGYIATHLAYDNA